MDSASIHSTNFENIWGKILCQHWTTIHLYLTSILCKQYSTTIYISFKLSQVYKWSKDNVFFYSFICSFILRKSCDMQDGRELLGPNDLHLSFPASQVYRRVPLDLVPFYDLKYIDHCCPLIEVFWNFGGKKVCRMCSQVLWKFYSTLYKGLWYLEGS